MKHTITMKYSPLYCEGVCFGSDLHSCRWWECCPCAVSMVLLWCCQACGWCDTRCCRAVVAGAVLSVQGSLCGSHLKHQGDIISSPLCSPDYDWFPHSSLQREVLSRELFQIAAMSHSVWAIHPILQLLSAHAEVTGFARALDLDGLPG